MVEQRVAGEVKRVLTNYFNDSGCNCYPWADTVPTAADYDANYGLNRGWLPYTALPFDWSGTYRLPDWFMQNDWYKLIYYSVAQNYTQVPGDCYSCIDSTLRVDGVSGTRALFFMPGPPIGTLTRTVTNLAHYLEDGENSDDANDRYVTPTSQAGTGTDLQATVNAGDDRRGMMRRQHGFTLVEIAIALAIGLLLAGCRAPVRPGGQPAQQRKVKTLNDIRGLDGFRARQ